MEEVTVKDPAYAGRPLTISNRLFSPYSFFVTIDVPQRNAVQTMIQEGGGTVVARPSNTTPIDYWLVPDFFEGNTRPGAKRVSIALDGAREGMFPPERDADYYSPFVQPARTRVEYTDGEVRFLMAYMDMHVGKPPLGKDDINYLYELMDKKHTAESIKSKIKRMQKFPVNLNQTKPVTFQAPMVQNDPVVKETRIPETPVPDTKFPDILPPSVPPAKRPATDTVLATPVHVKPLGMSTLIPDTTTEVPDTPVASKKKDSKTKNGNTQVPDTPDMKKNAVTSSQKSAEKPSNSSLSSSQSSNQVPDTPAKSKMPAATQVPATQPVPGTSPAVSEVPATPAGPQIQVLDSAKASKQSKSPSRSPTKAQKSPSSTGKQSTLPFKSVSENSSSSDSEPLVMRPSPKKNRNKGKEPLFTQVPFTQVENSSSPSSTRFKSSQMVPDSQPSLASTPLQADPSEKDSSEITYSQVHSVPLAKPPGDLLMTADESSLERAVAIRQNSESGESNWSRDSSISGGSDIHSQGTPQSSRAGRRTRAARSLAKSDPPPTPVQVGGCLLYPRKFLTRYSHHPVRGVFYGLEKVSSQQTVVSHVEHRQIEMTQVEQVAGATVVTKMTSSQSSSSFAEDSHLFVPAGSDEDKQDSQESVDVQVPDTQENHLLRDAQLPPDTFEDDVSSVPDTQVNANNKRPMAFPDFPVSSKRRYVDSSLDLDVSVQSLPSIENIRARMMLSDRLGSENVPGDGTGDILGSLAEKQLPQSSLGRQVPVLELDSDGDVVEESFIEEVEEESIEVETVGEHSESLKEYASIIYDDAQRRPTTSQFDEESVVDEQVETKVVEEEEEEEEKEEEEEDSDDEISVLKEVSLVQSQKSSDHSSDESSEESGSEIFFDAVDRFRTLLPTDVIDELLESYESEVDYPSEQFQVIPVPIRKGAAKDDLDSSFSVLDFPYEEISFEDVRDDLDYGNEEGLSQKEPMIGSLGIRPAVECVGLFLKKGVEEYLTSIQGHNPSVATVFVIALCMSRQVSEHTTLSEVQEMDFRFPRHVKFFSPKDDQVIAKYAVQGPTNLESLDILKKRHFAKDILARSEYLKTVAQALEKERTARANEARQEPVAGSSADGPSDRNPQDVKVELFDGFEVPREYNPPARFSPDAGSIEYDMDSFDPEPSLEERRVAMQEKLSQLRAKKAAKKARRREKRKSERLETEREEEEKPKKKKRRRKDEEEDEAEDKKGKKKRRKSKSSGEVEVVDLVDDSDVEKETPKRKPGRPKKGAEKGAEKESVPESVPEPASESVAETPKRKTGRKTKEVPVTETPKRKPGRPKKETPVAETPKATPGRSRKDSSGSKPSEPVESPKPASSQPVTTVPTTKRRGRPKEKPATKPVKKTSGPRKLSDAGGRARLLE
ncbi:hypothetical protein CJU90_0528 [Yarrowia sp. C11]|nr:hypothetical protein CJU90_0528 [Yarrowia sp. C11]